ncbi:HAMP domain-containing sensor histidine kinase [Bacillus sp. FJAT-52991]|uniref:histidine kinase n=1 Tax=Bacillus kandeliae TaxID=3129297 RepID=A0ABZ2N7R6_9BACI
MKWKLTGQFLLAIILTIVLSLLVFMILNMAFIISEPEDLYTPENTPVYYTLEFGKNIQYENGVFTIPDDKLAELKKENLWIQILDENGNEVYSRYQPEEVPSHYTPGELIFSYKFDGAIADSTIFVSKLDKGDRKFSYIIGYPFEQVATTSYVFSGDKWWEDVALFFLVATFVIVIIASLFGYLISRRLTKPMLAITDGVREFAKGNYAHTLQEKGLYKDVFHNLNELSVTLLANERERKKMEQMREEWVANITHDIKTPLASVKGYSEILVNPTYKVKEEERQAYAEIIHHKSEYISQLIDDLNMTYKLQHTANMVYKKEENIVEVLQETVIDILNHPLYEDIPLEFEADTDRYMRRLDRTLWKRALTNLLFNAIVHNPPGTPIHVRFKVKNKKQTVIEIEDFGKGIPEEELEKLFTRYYRGTNTGEAHKGSGLGLAIAKQVFENHGATIFVTSAVGRGTKVSIILKQ